jgi:hypothetical protein
MPVKVFTYFNILTGGEEMDRFQPLIGIRLWMTW